jgi:hypothetical protein
MRFTLRLPILAIYVMKQAMDGVKRLAFISGMRQSKWGKIDQYT